MAFTCPKCDKVFIVNGRLHARGRPCPSCGGSVGHVTGRRLKGSARLEWDEGPDFDRPGDGGRVCP